MIDRNGRPTQEALQKLRKWDKPDRKEFLDFASMLILWPGYSIIDGDNYIFVTGGSSRNESVIYAMMDNKALWSAILVPSLKADYYYFSLDK